MTSILELFERIPHSLIALLGRFSIAAVFWKSGQTKIEGFALDPFGGQFQVGWPRLAESTIPLFQDEYHLPLVPPERRRCPHEASIRARRSIGAQ